MNRLRRTLSLTIGSSFLTLLPGCAGTTKQPPEEKHTYEERVSSVLITEDGKYIVVIGYKYHYVFGVPGALVKALGSSFHKSIIGAFSVFEVGKSGETAGKYKLILKRKATESEKQEAIDVGFTEAADGTISYGGTLVGTRYASPAFEGPISSRQRLNQTYKVKVTEYRVAEKPAGKEAVTPVTIVREAALGTVFIFVVAPIVLTLFAVSAFDNKPEKEKEDK